MHCSRKGKWIFQIFLRLGANIAGSAGGFMYLATSGELQSKEFLNPWI